MKITIVYLTFRRRPRFDWFASSLARELRSVPEVDRDRPHILVVDGRLWHDGDARRAELRAACGGRFEFDHVPPKPSVWQGPHRLTQRDYFAAASARNTAFALARGSHVAFVDDLSVLLPGWLAAHLRAAERGYILCGTTCKNKEIVVDDAGDVVSYERHEPGQDSRLRYLQSDDLVRSSGGWVYGGTFSVPLEHALRVNGQDEVHDTIGGEDYDFGIRLERAGSEIYISRTCGTYEDEDGHHAEAAMVRLDKPWPPTSVREPRTPLAGGWTAPASPDAADGPFSSNYLYHRLMREQDRSWTLGGQANLRELRALVMGGEPFPVPTEPRTHWVDGQPLAEM